MQQPEPAYQGDEPYIFVSYSHQDEALVYREIRWLQDRGVNVWYDTRIQAGSEWSDALANAIGACSRFLYLITPNSVASENCRRELNHAIEEGRPILTVHLLENDVPPGIRLSLNNRQAIFKHRLKPEDYRSTLLDALLIGSKRVESPLSVAQPTAGRDFHVPLVAWISGCVLLVGIALFLLLSIRQEVVPEPRALTTKISADRTLIVVLPFVDSSGRTEQDLFADGMTDAMINVLGNMRPETLGVIARTSAMHYKDRLVTIETIGTELNVDYVVEGSVQRRGEQVRVLATLVQVSDQSQIWSGNFTDSITDVFTLQNRLATQIAGALAVNLLPDEAPPGRTREPDPVAYDAYLSGRFWSHKSTGEGWMKAITRFEKATRIDPDFAAAHAALADAYANDAVWRGISGPEVHRKALDAAQTALRLDSDLPEAHAANAIIKLFFEWDWEGAEAAFKQALRLNPTNGQMLHHFGHYLDFMGRHEEALWAFSEAQSLDPLSAFHHNGEVYTLINMGELKEAERVFDRVRELDANLPLSWYTLGMLRERQGRLSDAMAAWEKAVELSPTRFYLGALGYAYARNGFTKRAEDVVQRLQVEWPQEATTAMDQAKVYAGLGDLDRTFELIEKAVDDREPWIMGIGIDPGFAPIKQEARYQQLLRRITQ